MSAVAQVDKIRASDIFRGSFARQLPDYEDRPGQQAMAETIQSCLEGGQVALIEAGTGTGKTMAYLVPAALSGKRVVISTGTRALQDQLQGNDIPLLREALPFELSVEVLKGTSNYVCQRRLATLVNEPTKTAIRDDLARVGRWLPGAVRGDRAELADIRDDAPIWPHITTTPEGRLGGRCPFKSTCFVDAARKSAQNAQLVIVNHHLFFADLALRQQDTRLLPDYDAVIFDEAHLLQDAITHHFSVTLSARRFDGLLAEIAALSSASGQRGMNRELTHATRAARRMAEIVAAQVGPEGRRVAMCGDTTRSSEWQGTWFSLDSALAAIVDHLEDIAIANQDGVGLARAFMDRSRRIRDDLALLSEQDTVEDGSRGMVYWAENGNQGVTWGGSPVDSRRVIGDQLLPNIESAVFTSATLTTADSWDYAHDQLGTDDDALTYEFPSPFNYSQQALLYLPSDLPTPGQPEFDADGAQRVRELCELTCGGALILYTSHRALHDAVRRLRSTLPGTVLAQGDASPTALIKAFRTEKKATLLATGSFWQGVDIPGPALRLVVATKLPFSPPDDPIGRARARLIEEAGGSPFADYLLPRAVLALRQGLGRLIRRRDDRGVLAVLDHRMTTRGYGRAFIRSLPTGLQRTSSFEQTRRWWLGE